MNKGVAGGDEEEQLRMMAELSKTMKEGDRIVAPSRRPDGTLRKPIRIRAGYVPQEEIPPYQSKASLWRKEMEPQNFPPGYNPSMTAKSKTKSAKRNERKKEQKLKAAAAAATATAVALENKLKTVNVDGSGGPPELESLMNELSISTNLMPNTFTEAAKESSQEDSWHVVNKRIGARKPKILPEKQRLRSVAEGLNHKKF